jgi:hypothetical protein
MSSNILLWWTAPTASWLDPLISHFGRYFS